MDNNSATQIPNPTPANNTNSTIAHNSIPTYTQKQSPTTAHSTQPKPIRSTFGVVLLILGLITLASTFITLPMAIMGQLFDGPPDRKPLTLSILSAVIWLAPFSSITSGITALLTSAYVFAEHRIPTTLGKLLVLFITIPVAAIFFSFLLVTFL